jgi:hypothetical protein
MEGVPTEKLERTDGDNTVLEKTDEDTTVWEKTDEKNRIKNNDRERTVMEKNGKEGHKRWNHKERRWWASRQRQLEKGVTLDGGNTVDGDGGRTERKIVENRWGQHGSRYAGDKCRAMISEAELGSEATIAVAVASTAT